MGSSRVERGRAAPAPPLPEPLAVPAFDSHCHLDLVETAPGQALADAQAVGIDRIVTIGIDVPSSRWCAETAATHEDVWAAVAIHPNEADGATADALAEVTRLAGLPHVRAVGESGLDYYRDWAEPDAQLDSFRAHIEIAKRAGKPLVVHDREAHADIVRVLAEEGPPESVVFHCFSGDVELAKTCADVGYYMSFAGNLTFKNASGLRAAAAVAPADLLLVETDAPFLTPVPHRGKPNASYLVPHTVRALAELRGDDPEKLAAAVSRNGDSVFGPW